jgi:hypothetical protein
VPAKILAWRLKHVHGALASQEQTAFLPGRHIGENMLLLEMLPHTLKPSSSAVVVFCDMAEAYDTISRPFLYQLLQEAGLAGGFLRWVQLLLNNTKARACVDGYLSDPVQFAAGVRQGCPLAPQLCLFVGQALLQFLRAKGFGIGVGAKRLVGCQLADDLQVFLEAYTQLPELLASLRLFRNASGQALNLDKTSALVIGKLLFKLWLDHYRRLAAQQQQQEAAARQQEQQQAAAQQQQQQQQPQPRAAHHQQQQQQAAQQQQQQPGAAQHLQQQQQLPEAAQQQQQPRAAQQQQVQQPGAAINSSNSSNKRLDSSSSLNAASLGAACASNNARNRGQWDPSKSGAAFHLAGSASGGQQLRLYHRR